MPPKRKSAAAPSGKSNKKATTKGRKGRAVKNSDTVVDAAATTDKTIPPAPTSSLASAWSTITTKSNTNDCVAFAVLLSNEYKFRSILDVHMHDALAKDPTVLVHWLQCIITTTTTTATAEAGVPPVPPRLITPAAVHCVGLCESNFAPLIDKVLFPTLIPWMPKRYREFYLRSTTTTTTSSSTMATSSMRSDEAGTGIPPPPFIVQVLEQVFAHFDQTALASKKNDEDEPDATMQDASGETAVEEQTASDEELDEEDINLASSSRITIETATDVAESKPDEEDARRLLMHRSLELLCDLLSVPHTRRRTELIAYLQSCHWTVRSGRAHPYLDALSRRLLDRIRKWVHGFPVVITATATDDDSAVVTPLSASERRSIYHDRAAMVQNLCRRHYDLPDLVYAGVGLLCQPDQLRSLLSADDDGTILKDLLYRMRLIEGTDGKNQSREYLLAVLEHHLVIEPDPLEELQEIPLYPTEQVLWDAAVVPPGHTSLWSSPVLSLPKLNTQFISFADYLWRNWELLRSESSYEIRLDIVDALRRLQPTVRLQFDDIDDSKQILSTDFAGWARMAIPSGKEMVKIIQILKPRLGQKYPSQVLAEVTIDLKPYAQSLRQEWDSLREHDNIFLLAVDASKMQSKESRIDDTNDHDFPQRYGLSFLRGCMIQSVRDESGSVISDPSNKDVSPVGTKRTFLVALDPTQYTKDQQLVNVYDTFNIVVRRHGKANNFRSVLESVRSLMTGVGSIPRVMPKWMQSVLLGHSTDQACFRSEAMRNFARSTAGVPNPGAFFDFCDTFVDGKHLVDTLQSMAKKVSVDGEDTTVDQEPKVPPNCNFRVRVVDDKTAEAVSYPKPEGSVGNTIRFTPRQVEAIRAGLSPGLSLVVGPPGTGKTDVAVQIIASLYHSFPKQRTLIVTHSNAALNDIFQKVMARGDIKERYMIRLGSGERDLQTESTSDFTKQGRVEYSMNRRKDLLEEVQQLSESLGISGRGERNPDGSPSYTCETAEYFNQHQVVKRSRNFIKSATLTGNPANVADIFPFKEYFNTQSSVSLDEANAFILKLADMFKELAEYRPLEMLRLQRQRADYLIMKQAKVVAMTCTHAAIARSSLIELGFEYDNVIIEEAGQMLEIETFIPLLLQRGELGCFDCRLKRVTILGDHHQLPPVIQNMALARYTNLDQSMFARLIKHGVPCTILDQQGRARSEIADLYRWRYSHLGDLADALSSDGRYETANAGFHRTLQVVNVEDYDGKGETTPTPFFYQNVGEAEYCVAVFQYMVLIGYSPQTISILTTYNGQKELINDILRQRLGAAGSPLAGVCPGAVATVDHYQGQQNDYILLSLVRTSAVGHLRDIRRLIVAVSRARLGLYVFCRCETFAHVDELRPVFEKASAAAAATTPSLLQLVVGENHPTERKANESADDERIFSVEDVEQMGSIVAQLQEELAAAATT